MPLRTPTLPPATTTNTMFVGGSRLVVIESATPHPREQAVLVEFLRDRVGEGRLVAAILLTHHHGDHTGAAESLRRRFGAPILAHPETARRLPFSVDETIEDGHRLELGEGVAVTAHHTPGHAPGHLVFTEAKHRLAFAGDMVAGEGTILIDPRDDGDMGQYLASLHKMRALGIERLVPAHGPVLDDPDAVLTHYVEHRLARERKVLEALAGGALATSDLLARVYDDTPRSLWPLAARSLEAHLRKLEQEDHVERTGEQVRLGRGGR